MKELSNKEAKSFEEWARKRVTNADHNGRAVTYAILALVHELDELNSTLDVIRAEGIGQS